MKELITNNFKESQEVLKTFSTNENIAIVEEAILTMANSLKNGGKILSCGNGGSMCDAIHFAEELTGRFRHDRRALSAMPISDPGHITCTANDFGYDYIFYRYIEGLGREGDVLLVISTSGNSRNVIMATQLAQKMSIKTIGLLGKDGGELKGIVNIPIIVSVNKPERIQEIHIKIIHNMVEGLEKLLSAF